MNKLTAVLYISTLAILFCNWLSKHDRQIQQTNTRSEHSQTKLLYTDPPLNEVSSQIIERISSDFDAEIFSTLKNSFVHNNFFDHVPIKNLAQNIPNMPTTPNYIFNWQSDSKISLPVNPGLKLFNEESLGKAQLVLTMRW